MEFVSLVFKPALRTIQKTRRQLPACRTMGQPFAPRMPARTTFSALAGKQVLCLLDEDNLRISLRKLALQLSFDSLLKRLTAETDRVSPWVVLTATAGDTQREARLAFSGWRVINVPREIVTTYKGPCVKANADMDLCFLAGNLVQRDQYDAVLLGSGDGDLCVALARGIHRLRPTTEIHTVSVRGASSSRLRQRTDLFHSSIVIGMDLVASLQDEHPPTYRSIPIVR